MSELLPYLVAIAEKHLPQLEHDIENASTLYTLQAAVKQLHQYVTYIIHHSIQDAYRQISVALPKVGSPPPAARAAAPAAPAPASSPIARPVAQQGVQAASSVPTLTLPRLTSPGPGPVVPPVPTMPATNPAVGGKVMEVSITPHGTNVQIPGGPAVTLPPGSAVTRDVIEPEPVVLGPDDVVLPPGGGMTPDVEAALAAAGGARNITNEPTPGQ